MLNASMLMQVYKAVLGGSSLVAVKVLHETEEAANFGHEIAILRACRHSNIVQFQVGLLNYVCLNSEYFETCLTKGNWPSLLQGCRSWSLILIVCKSCMHLELPSRCAPFPNPKAGQSHSCPLHAIMPCCSTQVLQCA